MGAHFRLDAEISRILITAIVVLTSPVGSAAAASQVFDVPAGVAEQSFREFSLQAKLQVLFSADVLEGVMTRAVHGEFHPPEALSIMLSGTELSYEFVNDRTISVSPRQPSAKSSQASARLVGGANSSEAATQRVTPLALREERNSATDSQDGYRTANQGQDGQGQERQAIPEVLIKGSHSLNADIRRTEDDIQPYVVFTREQMERSQASNFEDFLKSQLPMNAQSQSIDQMADAPTANWGGINLRGLGIGQTLILVDGRRLPGTTFGPSESMQPNVSGIPLSAIERIEVLPATAGGIYGGSATGGVVNIVRRRDYAGLELRAKYGNTFESDVSDLELSMNGGATFENGRSRFTFSAMHSRMASLLTIERDLSLRARELLLNTSPATITNASTPPSGATSNICAARRVGTTSASCNRAPLTFDNGQAVGGTITFVPPGYAGSSADGGAGLATSVGNYNLRTANNGQALMRAPVTNSLALNVQRQFLERLDVFLDASGNRKNSKLSAGEVNSVFVAATAPNNPFQQDVLVNISTPGLHALSSESENEILQLAGGLVLHLPNSWAGTLERTWGRTRFRYEQLSGSSLTQAGLAVLSESAFTDLNTAPLDLSPYLQPGPNVFGGPFDSVLESTTLRASGPILHTRAGATTLSIMLERRAENALDSFLENFSNPASTTPVTLFPEREQSVDSYYAEASIPLISPEQELRSLYELEIQASVRRDEYETTSTVDSPTAASKDGPFLPTNYVTNELSSTDYTLGVRFAPLRDLFFRASFGTGFLPPSLVQISPRTFIATASINTDPQRGDTPLTVPLVQLVGGSPELGPEDSRSWSAGIVFTPRFLKGLRLSLDLTHVRKSDEIFNPAVQFILDNESDYPGRVVRGANLPGDPPDWLGRVTQIDTTAINLSATRMKSYDLQLDYEIENSRMGMFHFAVIGTKMDGLERQLTRFSEVFDLIGYSDGPLKWRGQAELRWQRRQWSAGWRTSYYDSYLVTSANPSLSALNSGRVSRQGSETIPSQMYHDAWGRFQLDASILSNTSITLGIQNVMNAVPPVLAPISASTSTSSVYSAYGDPRLRRYSLSISKAF